MEDGNATTYRLELGLSNRRRQHAVGPIDPVLLCPLLNLFESLIFLGALVSRTVQTRASRRIARCLLSRPLICEMLLRDLLIVLVDDLRRHALHSEDLDIEATAAGDGILNLVQLLLVDLCHVHVET